MPLLVAPMTLENGVVKHQDNLLPYQCAQQHTAHCMMWADHETHAARTLIVICVHVMYIHDIVYYQGNTIITITSMATQSINQSTCAGSTHLVHANSKINDCYSATQWSFDHPHNNHAKCRKLKHTNTN